MRGKAFVFSDFRGGINAEAAPYAVDATEARAGINMHSSPIGSVKKRNGFQTFSSPTRRLYSLFPYDDGSNVFLIGVGDDGTNKDIYKISTSGTATSIKGAATVSAGIRWEAVQAPPSTAVAGQGPIYMSNGVDTPLQWTGSGNVAAWTGNGSGAGTTGGVPKAKYLTYHDNRVFAAHATATEVTKSTVWASQLADASDWTTSTGWSTQVDPEDGEYISGLGVVGPYVLVTKPRKLFVITDTNAGTYRKISDSIGCAANRSIVSSDLGTFFLGSDRRIYVTDGSSISDISANIKPELDAIAGSKIANSSGVYHDGRYYLSVPVSSENERILEYDTRNASWWVHTIYLDSSTTTGVNDWAIINPSTTVDLYAAGAASATPRVFTAFKPNIFYDRGNGDSEVAYTSNWITGWNTYGQPHIRKIIRQIRADALGTMNLYTARKFGTSYTTEENLAWELSDEGTTTFGGTGLFGGVGTFGDATVVQERRFYTPGTSRAWSLKFESVDTQDFELYSYTVAVDMRKD